jgi:putative transposase
MLSCLEHVHLLVNEPKVVSLDRVIQALKLICFGAGKGAPLLASALLLLQCLLNLKQIEKLRYMHRNPFARGLVAKQEDWAWSSFRHYTTGLNGTVEIESFWTQRRREKGPSQVSEARPGAPRIE